MIFNDSKYNSSWNIKSLDQLGEFKRGKSKHRPRNDPALFIDGIYPLIQTGDIKAANLYIRKHSEMYNGFGLKQSKLWRENTLCITIAANIAETALLGYPMCFPDSVVGFTAFPDESSEIFMHYVFEYIKENIQNTIGGSIQDNINIEYLTGLNFRIPDKPYQDKIAAVLSSLDAKIELNQRINAELEAMAKTLYDYWFVQFDFPDEEGKPYKSSGGKIVWNEALKREIPEGWEVSELGKYCQIYRGVTYTKEDIKSPSDKNIIPILRATNINNGVIDLNDMVYVPEDLVSEDQMLEKYDVVITMSSGSKAHVGKNAFYYYDNKVSFGAFCSKLSFNKNLRFYVNVHMKSDSFKKYISNVGLGTSINNLTNKHITEYRLLIPPKKQLLRYESIVEGFYYKIGNNLKESQTLTELRDWLLPMLMNGQVKVG
ncbi:MAG TPA: restriction endonuclease subunit S [Anaerolineales bacterium]|nr:restriction endonuclease subunit S [Anaerolineales bacterium]